LIGYNHTYSLLGKGPQKFASTVSHCFLICHLGKFGVVGVGCHLAAEACADNILDALLLPSDEFFGF